MTSLLEILHPDFLLRDALWSTLLLGLILPLVGVFFVLRRMIFLGVALPQVSAAGIASAFLCSAMLFPARLHGALGERALALCGSFLATLATLLVLAWLDSRSRVTSEGRTGVIFAAAAAVTTLLLAFDPQGEAEMVNILKGDVLSATGNSLALTSGLLGAAGIITFLFRKQLLLLSFDRDLAVVFGMNVLGWDLLLYLVMGVTISAGVMAAGPIVTFGFLVIPPLIARLWCSSMLALSLVASVSGGILAFFGFWAAYALALPLGPAAVSCAALALLGFTMATQLSIRARGRQHSPTPHQPAPSAAAR